MSSKSVLSEPVLKEIQLRQSITRGAFWTILFSLFNKVVAFASQIALAWFLMPQDLGLVGMALSVCSIAALVSGMNLKAVLIHRQDTFDQDVGQVFWLSLAMGLVGTLFLVGAAPLAGHFFGNSRVVPLILLIAGANFVGSLPAIYAAALGRDLRFRSVAMIQFGIGLINNLGAIILAALHFGAYSLVVPLVISSLFSLVVQRMAVGRIHIPSPKPSKWFVLLKPAALVMCYSLLVALLSYGANLIIGFFHDATVAGFYFWGFSLASQAVFLLAANLRDVLFPTLAKLNLEPVRQYEAFRKACVVLLVATVPMCVLQILLAEPAIKLVFHDRWLPAAGVVQGLSIGLMTQAISILAVSLFMARAGYGLLCKVTGFSVVLTIVATLVGAMIGKQQSVAFAVGIASLITNLIAGYYALRLLGGGWHRLGSIVGIPLGLALPVLVLGFYLIHITSSLSALVHIVIVGLTCSLSYLGTAYLLLPEVKDVFNSLFENIGLLTKQKNT